MFYPLLRGKRFEAIALRECATLLAGATNVRPIVEPVKDEWRNLERALDAGLAIGIIVNPRVGDYSVPPPRARRIQKPMPASSTAVLGHANAIPTLLIDASTTAADVRTFAGTYTNRHMYLVHTAPRARHPDPIAAALASNPAAMIIRRRAVPITGRRSLYVDLQDNFTRQDNNSMYPPDEFFTDRHVTIRTDRTFGHFGDYSVQGDSYRDGGGPANHVALHHVYTIGPNPSDLRIKHYVSAPHPSVKRMWFDALSQLIADLPSLARISPLNRTSVLAEYRAFSAPADFPNLGKMKELSMRHHLELMTVVQ